MGEHAEPSVNDEAKAAANIWPAFSLIVSGVSSVTATRNQPL